MFHAQQSAGEILDWGIDYRSALNGATGLTSIWSISPSEGMTMYGATMTDEQVTIVVGSDRGGEIFVVTNTLPTSNGDTLVERIEFYISP
jgi:hypothetical protein